MSDPIFTITNFKDITLSLAAIITTSTAVFAALTGRKALSSWKNQKNYELHIDFIEQLYELQEYISRARNPFMNIPEEDIKELGINKANEKIHAKRFNEVVEVYFKLQAKKSKVKAVCGNQIEDDFKLIEKNVSKLKADLWLYYWRKGVYANSGSTVNKSGDQGGPSNEELSKAVFEMQPREDDELYLKMSKQIELMIDKLKNIK